MAVNENLKYPFKNIRSKKNNLSKKQTKSKFDLNFVLQLSYSVKFALRAKAFYKFLTT